MLECPALLDALRRGVDEQIALKGGIAYKIYSNANRRSSALGRSYVLAPLPAKDFGSGSRTGWYFQQSARRC